VSSALLKAGQRERQPTLVGNLSVAELAEERIAILTVETRCAYG
jgi:uncharacterized small protein (DUF1192 family)